MINGDLVVQEGRSQRLVTPDNCADAAPQRGDIQHAGQPHGDGNGVCGAAGPQLIEEPQPLLLKGERWRLATGVRLQYDDVREEHLLLVPEGAVRLNATAAAVLELCDGERSLDDIVGTLAARYGGADVREDVRGLLDAMAGRGVVVDAAP